MGARQPRQARLPFVLLMALLLPMSALAQTPETVGRIEGDDLAVKGEVSLSRAGGRSAAELVSGAEVTVRSGLARITLADGGEIDICGPALFTVLKSGGSLTLALNQGRVHVRVGSAPALAIYTALTVATPISIGDAPRDATIGVEADGSLCVLAAHGAVRLEQQLTGQSLLVPESGEVILPSGQLEALREVRGTCRCEPVFAREQPAPKPAVQIGAVAAKLGDGANLDEAKKEPPKPATEQPRWTVVMPPLSFDAKKPPPALEPPAETILLVRELRVQPATVFTGRVEKRPKTKPPKKEKAAPSVPAPARTETVEAAADRQPARASSGATSAAPSAASVKKEGSGFGTKFKNFFRRLFGRKPKN